MKNEGSDEVPRRQQKMNQPSLQKFLNAASRRQPIRCIATANFEALKKVKKNILIQEVIKLVEIFNQENI